jgi:hypothetical protein
VERANGYLETSFLPGRVSKWSTLVAATSAQAAYEWSASSSRGSSRPSQAQCCGLRTAQLVLLDSVWPLLRRYLVAGEMVSGLTCPIPLGMHSAGFGSRCPIGTATPSSSPAGGVGLSNATTIR